MNFLIDHIVIFSIALFTDLSVGDPPEKIERFYPIVWISRLMYFFDRRVRRENPRREKMLGLVYPLLILSIFTLPLLLLFLIPSELVYIALSSIILKMTFTIRGLERYALRTTKATDLEVKRAEVGKIVSREVKDLDSEHLNSATVESVAENLTDSVIAPFFYFILFGVLGAMVYRVINTLDAIVGYKTKRYLHFGWFSAEMDAVLNYIPERIAACLILLTNKSTRLDAIKSESDDHGGHIPLTIIAMSTVLHVNLEKKGYYVVEEGHEGASERHIEGAIRVMKRSSLLFAFICITILSLLFFILFP